MDSFKVRAIILCLPSLILIKDLGKLKYFLGIELIETNQGLWLSQRKYCLDLLSDFGLLTCKPFDVPLEQNLKISNEPTASDPFMLKPLKSHLKIALKVLRYLKGSPGKGVHNVRCITLGPRYKVRESSSAAAARPARGLRADYGFVATIDRDIKCDLERDVGYGITDSCDEIVKAMLGTPVVTYVAEFSQRMTKFKIRVDTDEIYTRLDDEQTERQLLACRLNMLFRDRHAHACTARLMEAKVRISREDWGRSMDASDLARAEAADRRRQAVITEMLAADRRRQKQFIEALKLLKRIQTQMTEFERQQGPAKGPAPEEAGSSS
ncbi:reverse transcriptase domain-containing protein [Tanacetum coccineum]